MTEQEQRLSPLPLLGDALLLVCALAGLAASFLSLYGGGESLVLSGIQHNALSLCAGDTRAFVLAACVLALLSALVWSLPRFRGLLVGTLALLLAGAVTLRWDQVSQGAGITVRDISVLFSSRVDWGRIFSYDPHLTQAQEARAAALFLLLALTALALALGWAVVRARRWWLVLALTLPPLLPGLLADLFPGWPPFMALCACWCAMLLTDLCKWAAPGRRGALTLAVLPVMGLVLFALTLALPREGYTRPDWALRAEEELHAAGDRLSTLLSQWEGPLQSTVTYTGSAQDADLAGAGPLRYTGRTMLRVQSDYGGRLYLRGSALGQYENGRWSEPGEDAYQEYLDALEEAGLEDAPSPLVFPALASQWAAPAPTPRGSGSPANSFTATVQTVRGSGVFAPYQLLEQDWQEAGVMPVRDSYLAHRAGLRSYTMAFRPPEVMAGTFPTSTPAQGLHIHQQYLAQSHYSSYVRKHYLDVPEELRGRLQDLYYANYHYRPGDGAPGPLTYAWRISDVLEALCEYDPAAPAAPEGTDPVEYFLFESRRGYCMHYASAAVLMLRTLGTPARYAQGYTAQALPDRFTDVPDYAAHAWVEVYVDGYGWYPVEVTPAAAFDWTLFTEEEASAAPSTPAPESEAPAPTPTPAPSQPPLPSQGPGEPPLPGGDEGSQGGTLQLGPLIAAAKALGVLAGIAGLLWLGQRLPKRRRARLLASPDHNRSALDGYRCLLLLRHWGGQVDPRAEELAQKARFSQHTLTREERDEMRAFVDRERSRLCGSLGTVRRMAFLYLWGRPDGEKNGEKSSKKRP